MIPQWGSGACIVWSVAKFTYTGLLKCLSRAWPRNREIVLNSADPGKGKEGNKDTKTAACRKNNDELDDFHIIQWSLSDPNLSYDN